MQISKSTLEFIEQLYKKEKAELPELDYVSFVAGAKTIVEHLIDKL